MKQNYKARENWTSELRMPKFTSAARTNRKTERKVGGKRYEARSRGRSSPALGRKYRKQDVFRDERARMTRAPGPPPIKPGPRVRHGAVVVVASYTPLVAAAAGGLVPRSLRHQFGLLDIS